MMQIQNTNKINSKQIPKKEENKYKTNIKQI